MKSGPLTFGKEMPILQETVFGWVAAGKSYLPNQEFSKRPSCHVSVLEVPKQIEKFWNLEEFPESQVLTREEEKCEEHFRETHCRDKEGRFEVRSPLRCSDLNVIGDSEKIAHKRLLNMERRMQRNENFKQEYIKFMEEYEGLNHMAEFRPNAETKLVYLPHHAVKRKESTTTELRVVFDGSAKTSNKVSLNDNLIIGPKLQLDLLYLILRFRQHQVVLVADICKMYRQINVEKQDRNLQCILWRNNQTEEIKAYQLNTVTYGTSSAPFLAVRCLVQLALENQGNYPKACDVIQRDFHMDDLITGGDNIQDVSNLKREVTAILQTAGFELRKWNSNQLCLLDKDPEQPLIETLNSSPTKTLCLTWDAKEDCILYSVKNSPEPRFTKQTILSEISELFDPLGLLSPVIIRAKILMQEIWQTTTNWDEPVSESITEKFELFRSKLQTVEELRIPRRVVIEDCVNYQLHVFADASEKAYGAAAYLRSINSNHLTQVTLLCAKSEVAPLKEISLPRLELCAAMVAAKLSNTIQHSISLKFNEMSYWSDSTITLWWIKADPGKLKTFVAHRIPKIQELTQSDQWFHISSTLIPADLVSRGVNGSQMKDLDLWWNGPHFLKEDPSTWSKALPVEELQADKLELKVAPAVTLGKFSRWNVFNRCGHTLFFSKYDVLTRILVIRENGPFHSDN